MALVALVVAVVALILGIVLLERVVALERRVRAGASEDLTAALRELHGALRQEQAAAEDLAMPEAPAWPPPAGTDGAAAMEQALGQAPNLFAHARASHAAAEASADPHLGPMYPESYPLPTDTIVCPRPADTPEMGGTPCSSCGAPLPPKFYVRVCLAPAHR